MITHILVAAVGLALLAVGADRLVGAAGRLALRWGLSPIVVGAVVIGLGTSAPELFVSSLAAMRPGGLDLAVGSIVGSNIANLSLVLGASVLLSPMVAVDGGVKREGMAMLVGSALFVVLAWDDRLALLEGFVLVAALLISLALIIFWSAGQDVAVQPEVETVLAEKRPGAFRDLITALISLGVMLVGGELLVDAASATAVALGVSEAVIGLTLVAIGTSLPELATVVAAARRRQSGLVLGNVVGSNLFNALGVGGAAAIIGDQAFVVSMRGPLVTMMAISLFVTVLAVMRGGRISRPVGLAFLATYPLALTYI